MGTSRAILSTSAANATLAEDALAEIELDMPVEATYEQVALEVTSQRFRPAAK